MTIHKSIIITFYNNRGCTIQYRYCAMCYQMSQHYSRGTLEKFPYLPLCPAVVRCSISGECSRSFKLMKLENHPHESRLALRRQVCYIYAHLAVQLCCCNRISSGHGKCSYFVPGSRCSSNLSSVFIRFDSNGFGRQDRTSRGKLLYDKLILAVHQHISTSTKLLQLSCIA